MKALKTLEMTGCIHSRRQRQILQSKASQRNINLIQKACDGDSSDSDEEIEQLSDDNSDSSAEVDF